jgi:LysM repeat protein
MIVGSNERRTIRIVKIRRRGRHASPSQVERVAAQAGKAAPAVVIAGVLVAAPQVQHTLASSGTPTSTAAQTAHHTARLTASGTAANGGQSTERAELDSFSSSATRASVQGDSATRTYIVRSGDTLSAIAERFYHDAADWQWLYHVNASTVANPNVIYVGQRLSVPSTAGSDYQPRHAKPAPEVTMAAKHTDTGSSGTTHSAHIGVTDWVAGDDRTHPTAPSGGTTTTTTTTSTTWTPPSGLYSCSDLEKLWDAAGGDPDAAFMAAEIAMAESGGNPNAISPTDDYGLWQINASNGALATLDPFQNAKSAIILSHDGTDWDPWTTYTSGAYVGRC